MSVIELIGWYAAALIGTLGSATFSGVETGLYAINRVRLHVLAHQPGSNAAVLERLTLRPNRILGTLLVGNNIVNYVASLAISMILDDAGYHGWSQVFFSAAILTPVLFIFGEVLPKDVFRSHADTLTYYFAQPLRTLQYLLIGLGILPLIDAVSRGIHRVLGGEATPAEMMHPRRQVTDLIREGVGHGLITQYQSAIIDRVLEFNRLTVADVMTPWATVTSVRVNQPPEAVWALANRVPYTRVPLVDAQGRALGAIEIEAVLTCDPASCPPFERMLQPIAQIDRGMTCRAALRHLQQQRMTLAIVVEHDRPIGLVTTKDLVEPIIGELEAW
jgi:CBS domain containing-hemolysin-like protein